MELATDSRLRVRASEDKLIPTPPPPRGSEANGGSIFDKLIEDYGALAERAEDMVFQHVCGEIEMELRAHFFRCVQIPEPRGVSSFNINLNGNGEPQPYIRASRRTLDRSSARLRNRNPLDPHGPGLTLFLVSRLFPIQPLVQNVHESLPEDRRPDLERYSAADDRPEGGWGGQREGG